MYLHMTTRMVNVQEHIKKLNSFLKAKIQLQEGNKDQGMNMNSMVIVIFVLNLVIRLWIVDSMGEEGLEAPMTQLDVGHVGATCHTLRCYTCCGFGHKAQESASQRSQPRRSTSYLSARRFEDQKTNAYSQGYAQYAQ